MKGTNTGMTKEESFNKIQEFNAKEPGEDLQFSDENFNKACERLYTAVPTVEFKERQLRILLLTSVHSDGYWTNYQECFDRLDENSPKFEEE